jgi:hypothetical protein
MTALLGQPICVGCMALFDLRRPTPIQIMRESFAKDTQRWAQHTTDNIDRINNSFARLKEEEFFHGVEKLIPNPFGVTSRQRPLGLVSSYAVDSSGSPIAIQSVKFGPLRSDGYVGVTVFFSAPHHLIRVYKSANQTGIVSNLQTQVTWDVTEFSIGGFTYDGAGLVVAPASGIMRCSWTLVCSTAGVAAGDWWGGFALNNSSGWRTAQQRMGVGTATVNSLPHTSGSGIFSVTAGNTVSIQVRHANAAGTTRDISGGAFTASCAEFEYVHPSPETSAVITGVVVA